MVRSRGIGGRFGNGTVVALGLAWMAVTSTAFSAHPLLRFPDIRGDTVVFVHAEDVWSVPAEGGTACRLTLDEGEERYPKLSPDGKLIAFTGELDGNPDVYVMQADGSNVRRLTFHPGYEEVVGWTPDGRILFSSSRHSFQRFLRLFTIRPDGSELEELPLPEGARGSFSPDGRRLAYNRISRENRTWKRYYGGMAQDIWLYDLGEGVDRRLTTYRGTDRIPMWIGGKIYFNSDRDGRLNIWSVDPKTGSLAQVTHHDRWDVHRPSTDGRRIVYELGGRIWLLDTETRETHRIPIEITPDPRDARPYMADLRDHVTRVACSPGGARVAVVARGEVFTLPRKEGPVRNLTRSSGSRERGVTWSPDGGRLAWFSDASGEYEIWIRDALGLEPARRLTHHSKGYRHTLRWSPDGSRLAYTDSDLTLWVVDVATGKEQRVDKAQYQSMDVSLDAKQISDFDWSPDGRWLAYAKMGPDMVFHLWLYDVAAGVPHQVTSGLYSDFAPVFDPSGRYLFFVSNRRFDPTFCDLEWEMVYKKVAGLYALRLAADVPPLFPIDDDEPGKEASAETEAPEMAGDGGLASGSAAVPAVRIDLDGLGARIEPFPVPRGNYRHLAAVDGGLLYLNADEGDFNRFEFRSPGPFNLERFDLEDRKSEPVAQGVVDYDLAPDRRWLAYRKGNKIFVQGVDKPEKSATAVELGGLQTRLDPRAEWRQIFWEAWRMERDFFYDPAMHGLDWKAVGRRYGELIDGASCPQDVTYVVGELIGELGTSHTYVYGRDLRRMAERVSVGMLGADYELDPASNRYRIARIYRVPRWTAGIVPPLARAGVDVHEGDYLLSVNGVPVWGDRDVYAAFQGLAGQQVELKVASDPSGKGARIVRTVAMGGEGRLRYLDWVEHNRRVVDRLSGGKVGYIHLPDTYLGSAEMFPAQFYGQTTKEGLVIDGRFNGGGLDPYIFLERLARNPLSYWTRRNSHDQVTPWMVTRAHMALVTNRYAGSGGDELPMEFRELGLGPIIGTRTWGGLVGVSMFISMVDGGELTAPDYRIYTPEGHWTVENEGVSPDVEVWLDPARVAEGHDDQLEKAVDVVLEAIRAHPRPWPQHPPIPRPEDPRPADALTVP